MFGSWKQDGTRRGAFCLLTLVYGGMIFVSGCLASCGKQNILIVGKYS